MIFKDKLFLFFISIIIIASSYIIFFVDKLYVSQTKIIVGNIDNKQTLQSILPISGIDNSLKDAELITEFITSYEVAAILDKELKISAEYKNRNDFFNKLNNHFTKLDLLKVYNKNLKVSFNQQSGTIEIKYFSSNPDDSYKILKRIVSLIETKLNKQNKEVSEKHLAYAKSIANSYKIKLEESSQKLISFQNQNIVLDPKVEAETKTALIASLEGELYKKSAEYSKLGSFMQGDAFELRTLREDIKGIKSQISSLKSSLAGKHKKQLNNEIAEFTKLKAQIEFDTEMYKNALTQYEILQAEVSKNSKIIVSFLDYGVPDEQTYPDLFKLLLITNIIILLIMFISFSIRSIIRDHI